jgi:hypothetical protein
MMAVATKETLWAFIGRIYLYWEQGMLLRRLSLLLLVGVTCWIALAIMSAGFLLVSGCALEDAITITSTLGLHDGQLVAVGPIVSVALYVIWCVMFVLSIVNVLACVIWLVSVICVVVIDTSAVIGDTSKG